MKIQKIRAIQGPNVFSHNPVLIMRLDLEDLAGKESYEAPGFVDRLLAALPGIHDHHCGKGRPGGFVERLHEGTWFGHIVEHVCLELTDRAEISVNRGKTVETDTPGVFDVAVEYRSEAGMRRLLEVAVDYVQALVDGRDYALEDWLQEVREIVRRNAMGPSTCAIVEAAEKRGIPIIRLNEEGLVQLGHGRRSRRIQAAMSTNTSAVAVDIAGDKSLTKAILDRAAVPVPQGVMAETEQIALEFFEAAGGPVVVKPLDGNQGKGVSVDLRTADEVSHAFENAWRYSRRVVVEQFFHGQDYRVLVIDGNMVAAAARVPAQVVGDGSHTVRELISIANLDPRRGTRHGRPMSTIEIDAILLACLKKQGFQLESVPAPGKVVLLRDNANLSTGGSAIDVTDSVHPSMKLMCERAARAVGLDICGVDLVVPDIAAPYVTGGVVEVNAAPGLRMHHWPSEGQSRDAGGEIVHMLFPSGDGRVPIVSITGTNGKTTVTRLIAKVLGRDGACVGMTTTQGIWINGTQVAAGDMTGPWSAAAVLSDPEVDIAVLETARGGIVRNGLGYDWSDVGVMTNIDADHIGQDGIRDVRDILRIKALVAERVRQGGTLVLNADDPLLVEVPDMSKVSRVRKKIVWFAMDEQNSVLARSRADMGTIYFVRDGWIVEARGGHERRILDTIATPLTFGGAARFQIANLLAAVAACRAMGTGVAQIRAAMREFDARVHNPARANLYAVNGGYVLYDYGHNAAALRAVCDMAAAMPVQRLIAVLGVPGDRADHIIQETGRTAGERFDKIILREDEDLRGRQPGEAQRLLAEAIRSVDPDAVMEFVAREADAVSTAIKEMEAGDLVVVFCDDCDAVRCSLEESGAVAAAGILPAEGTEKVQVA